MRSRAILAGSPAAMIFLASNSLATPPLPFEPSQDRDGYYGAVIRTSAGLTDPDSRDPVEPDILETPLVHPPFAPEYSQSPVENFSSSQSNRGGSIDATVTASLPQARLHFKNKSTSIVSVVNDQVYAELRDTLYIYNRDYYEGKVSTVDDLTITLSAETQTRYQSDRTTNSASFSMSLTGPEVVGHPRFPITRNLELDSSVGQISQTITDTLTIQGPNATLAFRATVGPKLFSINNIETRPPRELDVEVASQFRLSDLPEGYVCVSESGVFPGCSSSSETPKVSAFYINGMLTETSGSDSFDAVEEIDYLQNALITPFFSPAARLFLLPNDTESFLDDLAESILQRRALLSEEELQFAVSQHRKNNADNVTFEIEGIRSDFFSRQTTLSRQQVDFVISQELVNHATALVNALDQSNERVLLIGYSQGNLFANLAANFLTADEVQRLFVVSIATPSDRLAPAQGQYITTEEDGVIKLVRVVAPNVLPPNHKNGGAVAIPFRPDGHSLMLDYASPSFSSFRKLESYILEAREALIDN